MSRIPTFLALLAGGAFFGSVAFAAGWSDYSAAFPAFPCQDGWMACVVDGKTVTPDLQKGSTGLLQPADLRVGWDLQPTAAFSPFPRLSAYTGQLVAAAEPEPEPEPVAEAEPEPEPEPEPVATN